MDTPYCSAACIRVGKIGIKNARKHKDNGFRYPKSWKTPRKGNMKRSDWNDRNLPSTYAFVL